MSAPQDLSPAGRPSRLLPLALLIGGLAIGLGLVALAWTVAMAPGKSSVTELRSSAQVVTAVRELARLEAVQFHMERVIDLRDKQSRLLGMVEAEDAILLVAAADVIAGLDLSEMRDGDIVVEPELRRVTLSLPPPRVLVTRLDNAHTFVHHRSTDSLARRNEELETFARRQAESKLREAAIEAGILRRARTSVESTLRALVGALGFDNIQVEFRAE